MGKPAGMIVGSGKDFFQLLVGKATGLFEAVDGHADFAVDPPVVVNEIAEAVFVDDFVGDGIDVETHVLVVF